ASPGCIFKNIIFGGDHIRRQIKMARPKYGRTDQAKAFCPAFIKKFNEKVRFCLPKFNFYAKNIKANRVLTPANDKNTKCSGHSAGK
ncbi:hypothetical protein J0683_24830, partial [Vibrio parahaemolyticus]|uniref:hypothetical protein n=1 Tax=Vibrio parahaemolyticus TaxID=670 RepID=UPI001A8EE073|nr:hypothetical protein [Vibrio parahaemolyticus]